MQREIADSCEALERDRQRANDLRLSQWPRAGFDERAKHYALRRRGVRWALSTVEDFADRESDPRVAPDRHWQRPVVRPLPVAGLRRALVSKCGGEAPSAEDLTEHGDRKIPRVECTDVAVVDERENSVSLSRPGVSGNCGRDVKVTRPGAHHLFTGVPPSWRLLTGGPHQRPAVPITAHPAHRGRSAHRQTRKPDDRPYSPSTPTAGSKPPRQCINAPWPPIVNLSILSCSGVPAQPGASFGD